jgi:hypothetical protein
MELTDEQIEKLFANTGPGKYFATPEDARAFARMEVFKAAALADDLLAAAQTAKPPSGFVSRPATALAVSALISEGMSETAATKKVISEGADAFGPQVERQRAAELARYEAEQAIIAAEQPDAKRQRAADAMAARTKLAQDAILAREYLQAEHGMTEADTVLLTPEEAVEAAFSAPDRSANSIEANLAAALGNEGGVA